MIDAVCAYVVRSRTVEHVIDNESITNGKMVTERIRIVDLVVSLQLRWVLRVNGPIVRVELIVITQLPADLFRPNIQIELLRALMWR